MGPLRTGCPCECAVPYAAVVEYLTGLGLRVVDPRQPPKPCRNCKTLFQPSTHEQHCSDGCRKVSIRKSQRAYQKREAERRKKVKPPPPKRGALCNLKDVLP